ncbi:hypothetical protein GN958_ATG03489, partial [Phytophthora infestans]
MAEEVEHDNDIDDDGDTLGSAEQSQSPTQAGESTQQSDEVWCSGISKFCEIA